jgi:reactive intermediate/imine deaminase
VIRTDRAPIPAGPYSQAIRAGDFVLLAGQGPFEPDGSRTEGDFATQVDKTFKNLAAVAAAARGGLEHLVRIGVYLRDWDDFPELNRLFHKHLNQPFPARTTIPSELVGFDVEMDGILYLPRADEGDQPSSGTASGIS